MLTLDVEKLTTVQLQDYLHYAIAPRPICFASTVDRAGKVNLSPFSFFNMFSTNPPLCVFSPSRSVRSNTNKHTYENIKEVKECVINIINYDMVQQASLSSTEYPKGVNEFEKTGLTMLPSVIVKPPRVAESPVQLECTVNEVIELGRQGGAGNLILAEIKLIHVNENVLDDSGKIDQQKIDLVARLGGDWYCRVTKENLFKVPKPLKTLGIGVDALPHSARHSKILTGNDLGLLGNVEHLPDGEMLKATKNIDEVKKVLDQGENIVGKLQTLAHHLLTDGKTNEALCLVLLAEQHA